MHSGKEIQAEMLLTVVDRQNLALTDALRLVGILREMVAKKHQHHGGVSGEYAEKKHPHHGGISGECAEKKRHVGSLDKKWAHSDGDLNAFVQMQP